MQMLKLLFLFLLPDRGLEFFQKNVRYICHLERSKKNNVGVKLLLVSWDNENYHII